MLDYYYYSDWGIYALKYRKNNTGAFYNSIIEEDANFIARSLNMNYEDLLNICRTFNGDKTDGNTIYFVSKEDVENTIVTLNILNN